MTKESRYETTDYIEYLKALVKFQSRGYFINDIKIETIVDEEDYGLIKSEKPKAGFGQDLHNKKYTIKMLKDVY